VGVFRFPHTPQALAAALEGELTPDQRTVLEMMNERDRALEDAISEIRAILGI
jgi:anti-sigma factor RsiW